MSEKKKDIAILKAMGATDRTIGKIFVSKGLIIGLIGTTIGVCAGILLCFLLGHYNSARVPFYRICGIYGIQYHRQNPVFIFKGATGPVRNCRLT